MTGQDRRSFQRLKLAKPLQATMDGRSALIIDIGVGGAFVEHRGRAVPGLNARLAFRWQGSEIAFDVSVIRSTLIRETDEEGPVSQSAISFIKAHGNAAQRLEEMMASFVAHMLAAQRANAIAEDYPLGSVLTQIGQARRTRSRGLVAYRWNGITWSHGPTDSTLQPHDGFTVAAYEDEEELASLRDAYEAADEEGRNLIRVLAELSVRSAMR